MRENPTAIAAAIDLLVVAGCAGAMLAVCAGDVQGKAVLRGTPPPEKVVDLSGFDEVRRAYPELVSRLRTRHYRVSADGGLANVFVYVKRGLEGRSFPISTNTPLLDQTHAGFYPYVLGVKTNQTFLIRNSEPYLDTVHALPKVNREFNIAQPARGMVSAQQFEKPEVLIRLKREVHPWEFAFIGVVEHPFFAVTEEDANTGYHAACRRGNTFSKPCIRKQAVRPERWRWQKVRTRASTSRSKPRRGKSPPE